MASLSLGWNKVLQGEINYELRRMLTKMVVTQDIKFPRAVIPVDTEAEFELLGFLDGGKPTSAGTNWNNPTERRPTQSDF